MSRIRAKARILERTTTAGNGPYTLSGAVDSSYNTFASLCANGDTIEVTVVEPAVAFWTGLATFNTGPNRITLTTVEESSGTFGAGTKEILAGPLASGVSPISIVATGGSASAYTLPTTKPIAINADGYTVSFTPGTSNTAGAVTLQVDGGTAHPLRFLTGIDLPPNVLISGSLYEATLRGSEWLLKAFDSSIFSIPIGGIIDYAGSAAPNGSFALCQGQAISRTTFASAFLVLSTTYGVGNGTTTFNIPDLVGRVTAMLDGGSARLSASFFGGNPANLGAVGGLESHTLTTPQVASHTHANTLTDPQHTHGTTQINGAGVLDAGGGTSQYASGGSRSIAITNGFSINSASTGITINNVAAGGGGAHNNVQPTIILNKIIRVL